MHSWPLALSFALVGCSNATATPGATHDAGPDATTPVPDAGSDDGGDGGEDASPPPCTSTDFKGSPFGIHCNQLVDSMGRTAVIHGMNARIPVVFDNSFTDGRQAHEPIPAFGPADAARIRALGFNTLRLPINWSGAEPTEDGGISTTYLDAVAAITGYCNTAGLRVLIDLHQDDYSKEIGEDGAPLWAISPAPSASDLVSGPVPSNDNTAPAVVNAFSTFFGTSSEGQYLRDRYTKMATAVATRFADDPAVIGFELYNEPFTADVSLHPLYDEMVPAMRAVAPNKLFFWEPESLRIETGQATMGDGGAIGPGTVYAVHIYNEGTDWATADELQQTLSAAQMEAESWGAPLVVTEYGYAPSSPEFPIWVGAVEDVAGQVLAGDMFWLWKEESSGFWGLYDFDDAGTPTERTATVRELTRARLEALAGAPVSIRYDAATQTLQVAFVGSAAITAANVVSVGAEANPPVAEWSATCDGAKVATGGSDPLQIPCSGAGTHVLIVTGGAATTDAGR